MFFSKSNYLHEVDLVLLAPLNPCFFLTARKSGSRNGFVVVVVIVVVVVVLLLLVGTLISLEFFLGCGIGYEAPFSAWQS